MPRTQRDPIRTSADFKKKGSQRLRERVFFFSFSALLLGLDLSTKELALSYLGARGIPLLPRLLSLRLICNSGAALGMLSSHTWVVGVIEIIGCLAFGAGLFFSRSPLLSWGLSLGLAGGAGNLADRIIHAHGFLNGCVVDFIDYGWFIGNLADIYLFFCAICICVFLLRSSRLRGTDEKSNTSSRKSGGRKV